MIINQADNVAVLREAFYKIFSNNDPFGKMFMPSVKHKILLFPTRGVYLSKKQYSAFIRALKELGESSFYLSEIEGQAFVKQTNGFMYVKNEEGDFIKTIDPSPRQDGHWELSIDTPYRKYSEIPLIFDNALYSSSGKWGAILSNEDHVVFGGSEKFIGTFKRIYSRLQDHQRRFIESYEYWAARCKGMDISWISDFLKYINE